MGSILYGFACQHDEMPFENSSLWSWSVLSTLVKSVRLHSKICCGDGAKSIAVDLNSLANAGLMSKEEEDY